VWLGSWCRGQRIRGKRLVTFSVLPARDLAAAFAGLGCLLTGANSFSNTLSWPRFRSLSPGTMVHWKQPPHGSTFAGAILRFEERGGAEFMTVQVTRPLSVANKGMIQSVSESSFEKYSFSEQAAPTGSRASGMNKSGQLISKFLASEKHKWIWADGVEGEIVTQMTRFDETAAEVGITLDESDPMTLIELLSPGKSGQAVHSKLKLTHSRGDLSGDFPLIILDGAEAFGIHEHLPTASNLLVVLDRSEYQQGVHDMVLQLSSVSETECDVVDEAAGPKVFQPGVEVSTFWIDA